MYKIYRKNEVKSSYVSSFIQNDLKLQMEAQRICLSLVYATHVDQVREHMENDKENALSALKEELQFHHAQELYALKKNQVDPQIVKGKKNQAN